MKAVTVLISGGFGGAYERLLPEFERTSLIKVTTRSGSSQGAGPQTIAAQLACGVSADAVILSREGLGELIAANRIAAGSDVDLAGTVGRGCAGRDGEAGRDFGRGLQASHACCQNHRGAREYQRHLATKRSFSATRHRGKDYRQSNAARLGRNQNGRRATRGFGRHAGQRNFARDGGRFRRQPAAGDPVVQVFSAAVVSGAQEIANAKRLIEFFSSARATDAIRKSGMEPLATSA